MSFVDRIKAKPKKDSTSQNKVDPKIIQSLISTNDLSREYLDASDINSLINAYKHIVYICVNKNSTVMSTVGFKLMSKKEPKSSTVKYRCLSGYEKHKFMALHEKDLNYGGTLVEITKHPALDLLRKPNLFTTYSEFIYQTNTYKDLTGNSFWYIVSNGVGTPVELYMLPAQDVKIKPSNNLLIENYFVKNGEELIVFDKEEIIHNKTFDPANRFFGMSPLSACESVYNMREYMDRYEMHLYANDGRPSAVIQTENAVIGTQGWEDLRLLLRREIGGLNNAGKIALLDRGFDYKQISVNPRDLESLAGRKATASEIRNAFGQTDMLYDISTNRSASETADYSFRRDAILPRLTFLQDKINNELLPRFDDNLVLIFNNPVPIDIEKQVKELTEYVTKTILTPNEARHVIGWEPHNSKLADELLVPVNLAAISQAYMQDLNKNNDNGG